MSDSQHRLFFVNRFYAPDISASAQILSDIAEGLVREGMTVSVMTSRLRYDSVDQQLPKRETREGVRVIRIWSSRFGRSNVLGRAIDYLSFYVSAAFNVLKYATKTDVFIVKTDPPLLMVILGLFIRLRGARCVNWLQDIYPEVADRSDMGFARGPLGAGMRALRNRSLARADHTVVISPGMAKFVLQQRDVAEKLTTIGNFSDDDAIRPVALSDNPVRTEWGFTKDDFIIGYSGNLGRAHDIETMLGAAERLRDHPSIKFLFVGGGHLRGTLITQAQERKLTSIVTKPYQPRDTLAYSLGVPDVHWLSLRPEFEGLIMPSKFYGIAAAGRPMIFVGDTDGDIGRLCQQHRMGFAVETSDSDRFASVVKRLKSDRTLVSDMGRNARAYIDEQANCESVILQWKTLLKSL